MAFLYQRKGKLGYCMSNIIVSIILLLIFFVVIRYIINQKKKGVKCIGCASCNSGNNSQELNCNCNNQSNCEHKEG